MVPVVVAAVARLVTVTVVAVPVAVVIIVVMCFGFLVEAKVPALELAKPGETAHDKPTLKVLML